MSLVTTPAILLRSFPYSETSTILRFYTRDLGVAGAMARGARSRQSKGQGALGTFSEGALTLYVKGSRDLQTLKEFTETSSRRSLAGDVLRFAGASVLGEIVLRHAGEEQNPFLFKRLSSALDRLTDVRAVDPVAQFLAEAWGLVDALGYRPELSECVSCGRELDDAEMGRFDFSAGGVRCAACAEPTGGPRIGVGGRDQLAVLIDGRMPETLGRPRAHVKLLNDFVTYHVSDGKPLTSIGFFSDLLSAPHA